MENFSACFGDVVDPRRDNARHDLHELLVIALCAMLCGGEDCTDMALFGQAKEDFLRRFLRLRHGIPSHDTFSRLFRDLDPASFHAAFQSFMAQFSAGLSEVIVPAPWPTPEFLPGAAPYASETWDNGISLQRHAVFPNGDARWREWASSSACRRIGRTHPCLSIVGRREEYQTDGVPQRFWPAYQYDVPNGSCVLDEAQSICRL